MYYKYKTKEYNKKEFLKKMSIVAWLLTINIIFSLAGFVLFFLNSAAVEYLALKPSNIMQGKYLWTLFTHMFLHGGILHLFINMFVLLQLGSLNEKIIGRKRFFWFYIISGLFAGILTTILSSLYGNSELGSKIFGSPDVFMVGASGAIFAIAGLFMILLPNLRFIIIFFPFFSLPAYIMIPIVLFLTWAATIFANLPIGNVAHFGGFLAGIIYALYLKSKYPSKIKLLRRIIK